MEIKTFEDYLGKRYNDQLKYYESASLKNKKRYKKIQWTLIILSTLTTLLAALPPSVRTFLGPFEPHYAVVVTAAIVAILTSALNTFQYQELWANYRSTKELLNPEIFYYTFNIEDYEGKSEEEKKSIFVRKVETILGNEHTNWSAIKKANASSVQSQNDELLNKMKEIIKEKMDAPKDNEPEPPVEVSPSAETTTAETDITPSAETTTAAQTDNNEPATTTEESDGTTPDQADAETEGNTDKAGG